METSHCPQNKTFIRGASPGVSDELGDKNAIGGRRWDVATPEYKQRLLLRCIHRIKLTIWTIYAFRVLNPRQCSLAKKVVSKYERDVPKVPKPAEAKRDGVINP